MLKNPKGFQALMLVAIRISESQGLICSIIFTKCEKGHLSPKILSLQPTEGST